jgi:DNA-binding CsgD family transcriptional regulator
MSFESKVDRLSETADRLGDVILDPSLWPEVMQEIARRRDIDPVLIEVIPLDGAAKEPFLNANSLLILTDLSGRHVPAGEALQKAFALTPAETRLAVRLGAGDSLEQAAERLSITRETSRNQLKRIFSKLGVHRQAELIAILAKF